MKNYILLLTLAITFFSCKNDKITEQIEDSIEKTQNNVEEIVSLKDNAKITYEFLEDYATIKNRDELVNVFGETNLSDYTLMLAEGTVKKNATKIVNPKNWHHIIYIWNDETKETESVEAGYYMWSSVGVIKGSQKIESKNGLYTGMLLEDFVSWNGADIDFAGFGWDYAGNVFPGQKGQLSDSKVDVTLINKQEKYDGFDFMIGDIVLNSGEGRLKEAPVVIETLTLNLNNEEK